MKKFTQIFAESELQAQIEFMPTAQQEKFEDLKTQVEIVQERQEELITESEMKLSEARFLAAKAEKRYMATKGELNASQGEKRKLQEEITKAKDDSKRRCVDQNLIEGELKTVKEKYESLFKENSELQKEQLGLKTRCSNAEDKVRRCKNSNKGC